MYQRFKALLLSPKRIVDYLNDNKLTTFIVIFILVLLYTLPYLLVGSNSTNYISSVSSTFSTANINHKIDYSVKDYQLEKNDESVNAQMLKGNVVVTSYMIDSSLLFLGDNDLSNIDFSSDEYKLNLGLNILIVLSKEKVDLYLFNNLADSNISNKTPLLTKTYKELGFNNRDFSSDNINTLDKIHKDLTESLANHLIKKFMVLIIVILIIQSIFNYFLQMLLFTVLCVFLYRNAKIKFKHLFKIVIYSSLPYIICKWIQLLIGGTFIQFVGIVIMGAFMTRIIEYLSINSQERS